MNPLLAAFWLLNYQAEASCGRLEENDNPPQLTDAPDELEEATLKTLKS